MQAVVWGIGNYYRKKEDYFSGIPISAFVSNKEYNAQYKGINIINPAELFQYQFENLYIMAGEKAIFEILEELKGRGFQEWDKVVLGWNLPPYVNHEEFLCEDGKIICNLEGVCTYISQDEVIRLYNEADLMQLKQKKIRLKRANRLMDAPTEPISRIFGLDRGYPIERYYIEKFLSDNAVYIKGTVLEVAEDTYTKRYGTGVMDNYIMHITESIGEKGIVTDLATGKGVVEGLADCFIITQTLPFIFDVRAAVNNVIRFLKSGGVALVTVSGIVQISRYDMDRWGHFWSFTSASLRRLFEECEEVESVEITTYGNVKSAAYGLYGLVVEDLDAAELEHYDDDYQQLITAVVKKRQRN